MKIHKVYPPFYNGISEQINELSNDTYCKDMVNCVPDIVKGINRRPPMKYVSDFLALNNNYTLFHSYYKYDTNEKYFMFQTNEVTEPLVIIDDKGVKQNVEYPAFLGGVAKNYLALNAKLKGLTVQDRTWILNTKKVVTIGIDEDEASPSPDYYKTAFFWIKTTSGVSTSKYRFAVYLDDVKYEALGYESDTVATSLATTINANDNASGFIAEAKGSIVKITKADGGDFDYDSWDSWGNMASVGIKGTVDKITDLPKSFSFLNTYIIIKGQGSDVSKDYYVKWNGRTWEETRHPAEERGSLMGMPISMDRTSIDGNGVATFKIFIGDFAMPKVGNSENNPDPSFVGQRIVDIFFYKNRLALASTDSLVFSETANYYNFYIKTVLDIIDTDPIDIALIGDKSSEILYVLQFDLGVYVFTSEGQYEVTSNGDFSIKTVQVDRATNYSIKRDVRPISVNNRIFYISTANGLQKLYAYQRDENANLTASDLSLVVPTLKSKSVARIIPASNLGYTICTTKDNEMYLFVNKESGSESVQIGWVRWKVLEEVASTFIKYDYDIIESTLYLFATDGLNNIHLFTIDLSDNFNDNKEDILKDDIVCPIKSVVILPDYYPKITDIKNPNNKMLIKKLKLEGEGVFNMEMYRKDYKITFNKQQAFGFKDLNFHVSSKVGMVEFRVVDDSKYNFTIKSVTVEGLYQPSSQERI